MFKKRCDCFREQNHPLIEQKLPTSGSSKSGEEMNCFIGQAVGVYFGIKIFRFSNRGYIWPKLPPRVIFIWGNGFHACSRKHAPKAGRRTATENHRNCFSTSLASTAFTSHLRQFSAFGICVFSTGRYYRMYSPSLMPISSSIAAYCLPLASYSTSNVTG